MRPNFLIIAFLILNWAGNLYAQIDVKGKIKSQSESRADQRATEGVDKGLDAVENGVKNIFNKKNKKSDSSTTTEEEARKQEAGDQESSEEKTKQAQEEVPALTSYTKYDFIPGDQVLLFDDFSQDEVGDFPGAWTTNGSGEVRTLNLFPGKWFYLNAERKDYSMIQKISLPENYIIEFDVVPTNNPDGINGSFQLTLYQSSDDNELDPGIVPGSGGIHFDFSTEGWECRGFVEGAYGLTGGSELAPVELDKCNHVIIWVQKKRVRFYHKGQKVLDMPTVAPLNVKFDRLRFALDQGLPYLTNLRITTAAPDMRSKLLTEGKIVSYGIYFDVNSDKLKPESNGTLKEIAKVLTENPGVKIKIVGHTDGDGDAAKNLDLSKRRAAAVKAELASAFGVDASRIETDGKGKTEPIAPNDTPANKARNRRVEFLKI